MKSGGKGAQNDRCLENNGVGSSVAVDERTCCCHDAAPQFSVCALLKPRCCSGAGAPFFKSSVNDHKKKQQTRTLTKRTKLLNKKRAKRKVRKTEINTPKTNQT